MLNENPVINMLFLICQVKTGYVGVSPMAIESYIGVIPDQASVKCNGKSVEPAVSLLVKPG